MKFRHGKFLAAGALVATVALAAGYERISKDTLLLGAGSSSDKTLEFDVGSVSNPYFKYDQSEGKLKFSDDGVNEKSFGTGEGGANYVANASGADGVTGWTDANTTLSVSTSSNPSALDTAFSFDLATTVSGGSEEEVYFDITVGDNDKNRMLQVLMDFLVDANYLDDTLEVQVIADPTGTPETLSVQNSLVKARNGRHMATFATTSAGTYRIKLFRDSGVTLSSASTFKFNRFTVNSEGIPGETIVTDWEASSITLSNVTTQPTLISQRRVGENLEVRIGTADDLGALSGEVQVVLPSGLSLDVDKLGGTANVGYWTDATAGTTLSSGAVAANYVGNIIFSKALGGSDYSLGSAGYSPGTNYLRAFFSIPIQEWRNSGTTTFMSDSVVYANAQVRYYNTVGSVSVGNPIVYDGLSSLLDKVGEWSNTGGVITVPTKGRYRISVAQRLSVGLSTTTLLYVYVNGNQTTTLDVGITGGAVLGGSTTLSLNVGDSVEIRASSNISPFTSDLNSNLEIVRMADYSAGQPVGVSIASNGNYGLMQSDYLQTNPTGSIIGTTLSNEVLDVTRDGSIVCLSLSLEVDGVSSGGSISYLTAISGKYLPRVSVQMQTRASTTGLYLDQISVDTLGNITIIRRDWATGATKVFQPGEYVYGVCYGAATIN